MPDYLKLSQDAYDASTSYFDANLRADIDYSLRAFRNEHAPGSKYLSEEFKARSRIFSPKTRSIIRKNEAAAMQAAFSNREMVSVEPGNPDNLMSVAAAACMKEIMEYRLSKTIPTFETYLGGVQDAQTAGVVCSYQYWQYEKSGERKLKDQPCIELRPIENIRFDAGASWLDPVNTSPYFCDIIPMYVCDVKAMMENEDEKTGAPKWKKFDEAEIALAVPETMDSTRKSRLGGQQDPHEEKTGIKEFDVVWVMRWFMRETGGDKTFYTLGTNKLLTDAKPIDEVYFHGKRPYVIGYAILETHRAFKSSMPVLVRPIQVESTDIRNQRLDNVKFVLNKRWLVARGRQVDVNSLVRNVPGGVTLTTDPKTDVQESNWPDVTSSSFVEHDRLNAEFDDLAGNFSASTKVANNAVNDTLGGSKMASAAAGLMSEYLIRTINETWWEKVLRQLALLEQYYETDEVVLGVCAEKAQLYPRFGLSRITDMLLMNEVTVNVDMAMGDPRERMQKFLMATNSAIALIAQAPPGANIQEMTKEIYSNAGYRDGSRFFNQKQDPRLLKAMQMIQQLQQAVDGKKMELQAGLQGTQLKLASDEKIKVAQLQVDQGRISGDLQIRQSELALEEKKLQLEAMRLELEKMKIQLDASQAGQDASIQNAQQERDVELAGLKVAQEQHKLAALQVKISGEIEKASIELQNLKAEREQTSAAMTNESRISEVATQVGSSISAMNTDMEKLKKGVEEAKSSLAELSALKASVSAIGQGIAMALTRKKPKGFKLKKNDGRKTSAVVVSYDDGTEEEMSVN